MNLMEQLISEYKHALPTLKMSERALLEEKLCETVSSTNFDLQPWNYNRNKWLSSVVGDSETSVEKRMLIRNARSEELWKALDSGELTLNAAVNIIRDARIIAKVNGLDTIQMAIPEAMRQMMARGVVFEVNGRKVRRKATHNGYTKAAEAERERIAKEEKAAKEAPLPEPEPEKEWTTIRGALQALVDRRLKDLDVDAPTKAALLSHLNADIRVMVKDFNTRVTRLRNASQATSAVDRKTLLKACHTLGIDPPKDGKPIDMAKAKSLKKKLVRIYHPDANGGNEATRPQLEAVLAAFDVLERYNP